MVLLAGGAGSPTAFAQADSQISPAQARQVLDQNKAGLQGNASEIKQARNAILAPLTPGMGVAARSDYAQAVVSVIRPLATDLRPEVAINALRIAGELETSDGMNLLAEGLKDKREAVRMTAALGYARTFAVAAQAQPAILAQQVGSAVSMLQAKLQSESNPQVVEGLIIALDAATKVPQSRLENVHEQALDALITGASGVAQRAGTARGDAVLTIAPALSRAAQSLFDVFSDPANHTTSSQSTAAAGFAGDVVAMVDRALTASPDIGAGERSQLAFLTGQALRIYDAAGGRAHGPAIDLKLDSLLAESKDDEFKTQAAKLIGAEGVLTKSPFGFK
ncbi:MAG TPA: hypothetical protein VG963_25995, partial [Polyangiaceae bacterium]|nr:hypothetical protein [Polyangiaceae bacterium]